MTPSRLSVGRGNRMAVKYSAKPKLACGTRLPGQVRSFWRGIVSSPKEEMAAFLSKREAEFDVYVQRYVDDARTPIEGTTVEWKESVAPMEHVATIVVKSPQDVLAPCRCKFCEDLSFNPWHGLAAHKPLGAVNRVRRSIYTEISNLRHGPNQRPRQEPR